MQAVQRPGYLLPAALAAVVHLLFGVFLVLGLAWQTRPPDRVEVELVAALPDSPRGSVPAPPPRAPEPEPRPVPPEPRPVPPEPGPVQPKPQVRPAPDPPAARPGIALQEQRERELKLQERKAAEAREKAEQRKEEEARRKEQERQRLEAARAAEEERRRQEEARRAEDARRRADEARRQEDLRQATLAQERANEEARRARDRAEAERRAAAQAAAAAQKMIDEYTARIRNAIRDRLVVPPGIEGNPQAEFEVKLLKNGTVATVRLVRASGSSAYDRAVERAIDVAQPLPLPDDPEVFSQMRDLKLLFRPRD